MVTFLLTLFIVICLLLIVVVLLQKGRGGGLGAALGGGMASSAFGTRTGDVFTWVTIVLTGLFLLLAIICSLAARPPAAPIPQLEFDPPPGAITKTTSVSIKTDFERCQVFYTTDGNIPTDKSERYEKVPIKVKPGETIKAVVTASGGRHSQVIDAFYGKPEDYKETTTSMPTSAAFTRSASAPAATAPATVPPASRPAAAMLPEATGAATAPAGAAAK